MFDYDYFNGKDLPFPKRPAKPATPNLSGLMTASVAGKYAGELEIYEKKLGIYREELSEYQSKLRQRDEELYVELKKEFGPMTDDQFGTVWHRAWENGHAQGLRRVCELFGEYVDFCERYMEGAQK